jgi:hypothetical protein
MKVVDNKRKDILKKLEKILWWVLLDNKRKNNLKKLEKIFEWVYVIISQ